MGKSKEITLIILFFSGYFVLGLSLVDDYGIHWDDHAQYLHGLVTADYINELSGRWLADEPFSGIRLEDYKDRTHGVIFQVVTLGIQHLLGISDARSIFLLRHYFTFVIFFTGLIFFFRLLMLRFDNRAIAMLGVLFMILSPRIFADSFYNSKDIVFLSLLIISLWTLFRFLQHVTFASATFHALASALLISTRIVGVFVPAVTLLFLFLKPFILKEEFIIGSALKAAGILASLRVVLIKGGYYLFMISLLAVAFWPYLWNDPFRRFIEIFTTMSHFNWDDPVLFRGNFFQPSNLPFYYIPFWIMITTPILYSVFFLFGLGFSVFGREHGLSLLFDSVCLVVFFMPLISVILLGSVIYDGWRQLFFLYVPFLLLSLVGLHKILNLIKRKVRQGAVTRLRWSLFLIVSFSCVSTASFMIRCHPHQNVYFNFLAGKNTTKNFEADYWGLSYRQVLQHLLDNDPSDTIKILSVNWPGKANADIFPQEQRVRLQFTTSDKAHYYISNYRFPPEHDKLINLEYPYNQPVFEIKVRGNRISGAYLLNR
ncbi:MAG: hypothetical protein M0Q51_10465 [Bacteroidales bacterium]|nr:hypothetical protein [Bacteroidales bacterium]